MRHFFTLMGAIFGALYVALSAYISHASGLSSQSIDALAHAQNMHVIHVLLIVTLGLAFKETLPKTIIFTQAVFTLGVLLFAFTIYSKYLLGVIFPGVLTMLGGMVLIIAWLLLAGILFKTLLGKR